MHPLFGTIYNSIYFLAMAVEQARRAGRWVMGASVVAHARAFQLDGFCQPVAAGEDGAAHVAYVVLDSEPRGARLWPTFRLDLGGPGLRYLGHPIHWPHGTGPGTDPGCWFNASALCSGGECGPLSSSWQRALLEAMLAPSTSWAGVVMVQAAISVL